MDDNEKAHILRTILNDCIIQVEKKEARMRVWFSYEYPKMQRAENLDRAILGFLGPLSLLRKRKYKNENKAEWVEKSVSELMQVFYQFRNECMIAQQNLDLEKLSSSEIEQKIIWFINQRDKLFAPTISDLQAADFLGDLNYLKKHGYETGIDKKGNEIIRKIAS